MRDHGLRIARAIHVHMFLVAALGGLLLNILPRAAAQTKIACPVGGLSTSFTLTCSSSVPQGGFGLVISNIAVALYGGNFNLQCPSGTSYTQSGSTSCLAPLTYEVLALACLNKQQCTIPTTTLANTGSFGYYPQGSCTASKIGAVYSCGYGTSCKL